MNSWNQNQTQNNMTVGQAQFNPYWGTAQSMYGMRAPVYHAEPIHGEAAAWAFPIGGGEIWLPDADEDLVWWIKIDQNGNKTVTPFDVNPHQKPEPVDMNMILERLNNLEEKVNAKSNKSNAKRSATTTAEPAASVVSD